MSGSAGTLSPEAFSALGAAQPSSPAAGSPLPIMTPEAFSAIGPTKAGTRTGFFANVGAGVLEGIGSLASIADFTPSTLVTRGVDELLGTHLAPHSISEKVQQLPAVAKVAPADLGEGLGRSAARGATNMLGFYGLGRVTPGLEALTMGSPVRAAAVGASSGIGGDAFEYMLPEEWRDVAQAAGQIVGGGLALGAEAGARAGGRMVAGAGRAMAGPLSTGAPEPIINPETGQPFTAVGPGVGGGRGDPIRATPRQQTLAAGRVSHAMGMEPGAAADAIQTNPWGGSPLPLAAGVGADGLPISSQLTIGQMTGNLGALGLERQLRNQAYGRAAFTEQEAQNNLARIAALQGAAPAEVADAAREWFLSKLKADQLISESDQAAGRAAVEGAAADAGATGTPPNVQDIGTAQRATLDEQRSPIKAALSRAYRALDPDGTLAVDTTPVFDAQKTILQELGKSGRLIGDETAVMDAARDMRGVNLFSDLRGLQSDVSEALRSIRRDVKYGTESKPYRRMSMLMDSVNASISEAAARAAERDSSAGAGGGRIVDRLQEIDQGAAGSATGGPGAGVAGAAASGGEAVAPGAGGAGAPAVGPAVGSGGAAGDRAVAPGATDAERAPIAPRARAPQSLLDFIIQRGGVVPDADLLAMDADKYHHRQGGRLVNKNGEGLDYSREAAQQEGFPSHVTSDINAYRQAIGDELAGRKVYRPEEEFEAQQQRQLRTEADQQRVAYDQARDLVLRAEADEGARLSPAAIDHAVDMLAKDPEMHPAEALRLASMVDEETLLQRNAQLSDMNVRPGVHPLAFQSEAQLPGGHTLVENMSPQTAADVSSLNRRYADYKETYRQGAVGDVLKSGQGPGGFRLGPSSVPGTLFKRGPGGAEAADSLIKAAGGVAKAQEILGDYPALVFRNMAMRDGTFSAAGYQRFLAQYAPVLSKFPEVAAKFRTVAEAQRTAEAAADAGQARLKEFQNSAARFYLGKGEAGVDNQRAIADLLASKNPAAEARDLMRRAAPNDAAVDGIRRNLLDHLQTKATSTAEAGTSGEKALAGAAYQKLISDPKTAGVLDVVLTPEQRLMTRRVGKDLELAARAWNAVKVPGSPGTAADLEALGHDHGSPSGFIQMVLGEKGGEVLSHLLNATGVWGKALEFAGTVAGLAYEARRAAGIQTVNDLVTEMQLQPMLGRHLLKQAITNPKAPALRDMTSRIVPLLTGASTSQMKGAH